MTLIVRDATRADASAISHIRVDTWRAAYAGLVAQEVLDHMDAAAEAERRLARWDEMHGDPRGCELVAARSLRSSTHRWALRNPAARRRCSTVSIRACPTPRDQCSGRA